MNIEVSDRGSFKAIDFCDYEMDGKKKKEKRKKKRRKICAKICYDIDSCNIEIV